MSMGDWMRTGRVTRFFMYLLFSFAGFFSFWNSLITLEQAGLEFWGTRIWSSFLFVGGLLGVVTAITDRWMFEFIGLVMLGTVFATVGASLVLTSGLNVGRLATAAIFIAFALSCAVRWKVINNFAKLSVRRSSGG